MTKILLRWREGKPLPYEGLKPKFERWTKIAGNIKPPRARRGGKGDGVEEFSKE
jgi:hypothetical protein